jgi:hypothetical protein
MLESIALASPTPKIKRAATCVVGLADFLVFAVGLYSVFEILLSDFSLMDASEGTQAPWNSLRHTAFVLIVAIV